MRKTQLARELAAVKEREELVRREAEERAWARVWDREAKEQVDGQLEDLT